MLERSLPDDLKTELFETSLSTLRRNIGRLDSLIKRVLQDETNLQLADSTKVEKREFDLWSLVESTIQDLYPIATDSCATLINDVLTDMTMVADARLLGQVFQICSPMRLSSHLMGRLSSEHDTEMQMAPRNVRSKILAQVLTPNGWSRFLKN